ncbi:unnamed protein product [Paramecium sonneborni]|uniref:Uncharacterized protein n=1 Tax=Paramecium sonneborni TaxID=65129 RepID=A0A8S1RRA8_9CILI|nr:unnamed protein product [Paramecium sonneborni]
MAQFYHLEMMNINCNNQTRIEFRMENKRFNYSGMAWIQICLLKIIFLTFSSVYKELSLF